MAIDLSILEDASACPAGLRIEHVLDRAGLERWVSAFAAGFERSAEEASRWLDAYASFGFGPDAVWQHYVGLVDDEPVATSSLFLGGGVAGLYHIVTAQHQRGRGIGTAITRFPLQEARVRGYRIGVLQASAVGAPVYRSLGFEACCQLSMYAWQPPREADGA
jgi:GNAT superfamily N-acetyltransferase